MSGNLDKQIEKQNKLYKEQDELYHSIAFDLGLSDCAFWILYVICEGDCLYSQQDLSELWFYPKQTINSAIVSLVKKEYVYLSPMEGTKHKKAVALSEKGREFCEKGVVPVLDAERKAFARFSEDEREIFLELFEKQIGFMKEETELLNKEYGK